MADRLSICARRWPALALVVASVLVAGCERASTTPLPLSSTDTAIGGTQSVAIADRTFMLELALTPQARQRGLSYRNRIPSDGGMLFVFPYEQMLSFWMHECRVPIDLIFLDGQGKVINWHRMPAPSPGTADRDLPLYVSDSLAQFAIELAGGTIPSLGLRRGQTIDLPLESLKQHAH